MFLIRKIHLSTVQPTKASEFTYKGINYACINLHSPCAHRPLLSTVKISLLKIINLTAVGHRFKFSTVKKI